MHLEYGHCIIEHTEQLSIESLNNQALQSTLFYFIVIATIRTNRCFYFELSLAVNQSLNQSIDFILEGNM